MRQYSEVERKRVEEDSRKRRESWGSKERGREVSESHRKRRRGRGGEEQRRSMGRRDDRGGQTDGERGGQSLRGGLRAEGEGEKRGGDEQFKDQQSCYLISFIRVFYWTNFGSAQIRFGSGSGSSVCLK